MNDSINKGNQENSEIINGQPSTSEDNKNNFVQKIKRSSLDIAFLGLSILTLIVNHFLVKHSYSHNIELLFPELLFIILLVLILCLVRQKHSSLSYSIISLLLAVEFFIGYKSSIASTYSISDVVLIHLPFYSFVLLGIAFIGKDIFSIPSWNRAINYFFIYCILLFSIIFVIRFIYTNSDSLKYIFPNMSYFEIHNFSSDLSNSLLLIWPYFSLYLLLKKFSHRNFLKALLLNLLMILTVIIMYDSFNANGFYRTYFIRDNSSPQFLFLCLLVLFTILFMFSDLSQRKIVTKILPLLYIIIEIVLLFITLKAINVKFHTQITHIRIAALGDTILLLILLFGMLINYIGFLFKKKEIIHIQKWILSMIPIFLIWIILLPFFIMFFYKN